MLGVRRYVPGAAGQRDSTLVRLVAFGLIGLSVVSILRQFFPQLLGILTSQVPAATVFHEEGFYFLTVARSIASGLGPTADGTSLTTGFQPLWAGMVSVPFVLANLFGGEELVYVLALMLGVLLASLVLAGYAANAVSRTPSSFLFVVAFAVFANDLRWLRLSTSGLETTLYMSSLLWLLVLWTRSPLDAGATGFSRADRKWSIWFGVALGIAFLSRVDAVFFGFAYLAAVLFRTRFTRRGLVAVLIAGGISSMFLAAWLAYPQMVQGTPIPQSGTATSGGIYPAPALSDKLWTAAGQLASHPLSSLSKVIAELGPPRWLGLAVGFSALGLLLALTHMSRSQVRLAFLVPHAIGSVLLVGFYSAFSHTPWRFDSYFMPVELLVLLLLSLVVYSAWRLFRPGLLLPLAALLTVGFVTMHSYLWATRPVATGDWITPAVQWLAENDFDSPVYMFQTGRTGYQFPGKVVNLDGKMNFEALTANREGRLLEYLVENDARIVFDSSEYLDRFLPLYPGWNSVFVDRSGVLSPPEGWFVFARRAGPQAVSRGPRFR